jgi:hypothetical protein
MSVLSSTYLEAIPDRNRYGVIDTEHPIEVHIASAFFENVHISLEQTIKTSFFVEVNLTIEEAEAIAHALQLAIAGAKRGREGRR